MRVTQNMMYSEALYNMNKLLGDYMVSNEQAASQKRINRPSDDPVGTINVMNYRASISTTTQYLDNSEDAASWLASTDSALLQTQQVILTRLSELAEQAADGTKTAENRYQISFEARQLFEQLVNVANTEYAGQHLFSGHKTNISAYDQVLGITTYSPEMEGVGFSVDGQLERTAIVRFADDAQVTVPGGFDADTAYEYSLDGGETWVTGTVAAGATSIDVGGSIINFEEAVNQPVNITAFDPDGEISPSNGTVLYVRPAAVYNGDDSDPPPDIDIYGEHNFSNPRAEGVFSGDVQIKIDEDANVNVNGEIRYSYSTDNGTTWESASVPTDGSTTVRLIVPNGYLDMDVGGDGTIEAGQQIVIRPDRAADIGYEISADEFLDVTIAGKDIFGGLYQGKNDEYDKAVEGVNIFESLGKFISALETNNQDQCGEALEEIKAGSEHLLTELAKVGGKENRVSLNISILQFRYDDEANRMSGIEDVDIAKLTVELTRQQAAYETVLKSSSLIMNMSLMDYL